MANLCNWWATYALNAAWQVAVLVAAGVAASWLLRRARGRWQHLIWIAVAGLCFALPIAAPRSAAAGARISLPLDITVERLIAGGVALAALVRVVQLYRGWRSVRSWSLAASDERSPRVQEVARECQCAMGLPAISIRAVAGLPGPLTWGLWSPVILLPEGFEHQHPDDVLRAALGHEMAHIRRRDYAWNLACEALLLPLAWHPAVWRLRRNLDRTRELACDEMTAAKVLDGRRYARSLVAIAASVVTPGNCQPALGVTDGGDLELRVRRLVSAAARPLYKLPGHSALAGVMLFTAALVAVTLAVQSGWEARDVRELGVSPATILPPPPPPPPK